jgi:hypothetical protein
VLQLAENLALSGETVNYLPIACIVVAASEKANDTSAPVCCNCKLEDGEKPQPSTRSAKKVAKNTKTTTGRVFSCNYTTPVLSFAVALRNHEEQRQLPHPVAAPTAAQNPSAPAPVQQQETDQLVRAPNVNRLTLDNMFSVVSVVQQIMRVFNDAVPEEAKIVVITKIAFTFMKQNGHSIS